MSPAPATRVLKAVAIVLVGLAVSAVAVRAGFWQLGRHEARAAAIEAYEANASLPVIPLAEAVGGDATVSGTEEWRRVETTGVIDVGSLTLLRNRPVDRERAYQLLVWLDVEDGTSVLLNAGWVPVPDEGDDLALPAWPDGVVTLTGVLRTAEADDGRRDDGATRVTPAQMPTPQGLPIDGYVMLQEDALAAPAPLPTLSLGPHLAYTWQWFAFALLAPVGSVMLARREWARDVAPGDRDDAPAPRERAPRRRRSGPTDEEIEDAL